MKEKGKTEDEQFKAWLRTVANLGENSARDVLSRVRRAACLITLDDKVEALVAI